MNFNVVWTYYNPVFQQPQASTQLTSLPSNPVTYPATYSTTYLNQPPLNVSAQKTGRLNNQEISSVFKNCTQDLHTSTQTPSKKEKPKLRMILMSKSGNASNVVYQ